MILIACGALVGLLAAYVAYATWSATPTEGPCLLFFRSDTCPYCKEMAPIVDGLRRKYGRQVDFVYVNVSEEGGERIGRQHGIIATPTLLLLDSDGHQMNVLRGTLPESVIEQAIVDLVAQ